MRSSVRRALVVAGAVAVVLGTGAGVAAGAPMPVLARTPSSVDFGRLTTPGATASQVFTLNNTGGAASSALTITVAPPYTTRRDTCTGTSLGPGKSCTVTVTFTAPATPGSYPGTLTATAALAHVGATAPLNGQSGKIIPTISTAPQPAVALATTPVADQATVTGPAGDSPTGTVTFQLYNNSTCTDPPVFTPPDMPLSNTGTANSGPFTPQATGTYYWKATYSGDNNNSSVSSGCNGEPVTVSNCLVTDTTTTPPQAFADLQRAVSAATSGDKLIIEGECGGVAIGKDLMLTGQAAGVFTTATLLSGSSGSVLTINSNTNVTLNTLTITGGETSTGGGILNHGNLTVFSTTITHSSASDGGGIYNDGSVVWNSGTIGGGSGSSDANTATDGGGIYNADHGTVELNGGAVSGNASTYGGGIYNASGGTVTLGGGLIGGASSSSDGNSASEQGGGIFNDGTVNQFGAKVTFNSAGRQAGSAGGGIFECGSSTNNGIATPPASDPNVTNNIPDDVAFGTCP